MYMPDDTDTLEQPNWGRERGKNAKQNRSQEHEKIEVGGYTRADGTRVEGYRRRSPVN